jgi:hypothetical protein
MSRPVTLLVSALLILGANVSPSLAADTQKGTFRFGDLKFEPADALVYQVAGAGDEKPLTIVIMTNFKIDRPAVMEAIDTPNAVSAQAANREGGAFLIIRALAADHCGLAAFLNRAQKQIDLSNSYPAKMTLTGTRVAGECSTSKPEKMFDDVYEFQLSYDLPLTTIPKPTVLSSGGGEPGAAYASLVKAIQAADWNAAYQHLAEDEVPKTKPQASDMSRYFEGLALNYPKSVTVTGGLMKGDRATLDLMGTDHDGKKIRGGVAMKKTSSGWRVLDQSFYFTE